MKVWNEGYQQWYPFFLTLSFLRGVSRFGDSDGMVKLSKAAFFLALLLHHGCESTVRGIEWLAKSNLLG